MALEDQLNKTQNSSLTPAEYVEVVQAVIDNRDDLKKKPSSISVNGGEKAVVDQDGNINVSIEIKNAYELAVQQGFVGTLDEWLASLKGKDGKDGSDGADGADGHTPVKGVDYFDGKDGKDGEDGKDGKDGSILFPSTRVDAAGYLVCDVPDASEGTNFDIDGEGYLCVDFPDVE